MPWPLGDSLLSLPLLHQVTDMIFEIMAEQIYVYTVVSGVVLACLVWIYRRLEGKETTKPIPDLVVSELRGAVEEMREFVAPRARQRFLKRDRVGFYAKKLIRRVEDNVRYVEDLGLRKQRQGQRMIRSLAKNLIGEHSDSGSSIDCAEGRPAEDYLEEEEESLSRTWIPAEVKYLLKSFHMFGEFDPSVFAEIYPAIETVRVPAGQYLFRIGEPDVNIFVVQSGRLDVTTTDSQGTHEIKRVGPGESLTSLLSFIDMLTGHLSPYKTVQARAGVDSVVLRLSVQAFMVVFDKRLELLVQVVQMIMARLQRVVFVALHQYLGLSKELIRPMEEMELGGRPLSLQQELALAGEGTEAREAGIRGLQAELSLEDDTYLRQVVEVRRLEAGDTLMSEASYSDVALVYIISGELTMLQVSGSCHDELYTAETGECVGQLAMLTGEANFYTCRARAPSLVALLSKASFFSIVSSTPEMVLSLAQSTIRRLSSLVRKIDFALDWVTVEGGRTLPLPPATTFIVLSGRLRGYTVAAAADSGAKQLVGEYGRGDMVGIVDLITGSSLEATYLAVRDTEVCIVPASLLEFLKIRCTAVLSKLVQVLGNRLLSLRPQGHPAQQHRRQQHQQQPQQQLYCRERGSGSGVELSSGRIHYSSVAVITISKEVPSTLFCLELQHSLSLAGPVALLSSAQILKKFGQDVFHSRFEYRLNGWLNQQEDRHESVIYQCDATATSAWTRKCFRHADVILILADGGAKEAAVTAVEKEIEALTKRIRKELVLIHAASTLTPTGTREWLKRRPWLSCHFHLKRPDRLEKFQGREAKERVVEAYSRLLATDTDITTDFARLARHLQGQNIGLVLGGGGARGAAHLGMIRSIVEAGIPIDKVGGVSIGAFMGALWGAHRDLNVMTARCRQWFTNMCRYVGLLDLTYPITSLFAGNYFNWTLTETFGTDLNIEDLWLPFYCVSTDVTLSSERVHLSGCVWRYCRASMSYAWILPPLCDPKDGHLLMDGCYVNNVPGDIMLRENSCSHIIAVDVTAIDSAELTNYGDSLSGWRLLWNRLNPLASPLQIPTQAQIQERLTYVSHYRNLEQLKNNPDYEYIQPPVGHFSSAKFDIFEEIYKAGYHHGTTFFYGLRKSGGSENGGQGAANWLPTADRFRMRSRRTPERKDSGDYTFTDLAHLVASTRPNQGKPRSRLGTGESIRRARPARHGSDDSMSSSGGFKKAKQPARR